MGVGGNKRLTGPHLPQASPFRPQFSKRGDAAAAAATITTTTGLAGSGGDGGSGGDSNNGGQ